MNKWTLMVYISADDVLDNFAVESLKQLKRGAGDGIEVFAQFDPNVDGEMVTTYHFSDSKKSEPSIKGNLIGRRHGPVDMTAPTTLTQFINMATRKCRADHYGLVLWGHGPELLFDDNVPRRTTPSSRRYFTPGNLRQALQDTDLVKGKLGKARLDIVAIDACCGALVEVASALQGYADYLIASQDDVPDASFPYEQLLDKLRPLCKKDDVQGISKMVPKAYNDAFVDYISTPANELRGITLSTVDLDSIGTITNPLTELANSLLQASIDARLRRKILDARKEAHAFEFGLFVDLFDFCEQLDRTGHGNDRLTGACKSMRAAITKCVIENQARGTNSAHCNGLSVYLPYQTNEPIEVAILAKNGTNHPTKDRINRITELEQDYSVLTTLGQPRWMQFIKSGWSPILAKEVPDQLDTHYSAQQCAQNLLPAAEDTITLSLRRVSPETQKPRRRPTNGAPNGSIVGRQHQYPEKHPAN